MKVLAASETAARGQGPITEAEARAAVGRVLELRDVPERIFTQTIDGADEAARLFDSEGLRAVSLSSKDAQDQRRSVLRKFGEGRIDVLAAPRILDEGIDVPEADLGIIVATSRSRRQMVQRMGRVLRRKKDGRLARFAIIYVEDTIEDPRQGAHESFLDEVTSSADEVATFGPDVEADPIVSWLNDLTPTGSCSEPRFEGEAARLVAPKSSEVLQPCRPGRVSRRSDADHVAIS